MLLHAIGYCYCNLSSQGQILDTVTVVGADNKSVTTTVSGNTATFTMPDQDVTVTNVTFRTAETYK